MDPEIFAAFLSLCLVGCEALLISTPVALLVRLVNNSQPSDAWTRDRSHPDHQYDAHVADFSTDPTARRRRLSIIACVLFQTERVVSCAFIQPPLFSHNTFSLSPHVTRLNLVVLVQSLRVQNRLPLTASRHACWLRVASCMLCAAGR